MRSKFARILISLTTIGLFVAFSFTPGSRSSAEDPQGGPQIEITAPAHTATVSHQVVLGAREKAIPGNPVISWVDFFIDGAYIGSDSKPPFEYLWNTDLYPNGNHSVEYRAYDELGRYTSRSITVKVSNISSDTVTKSFSGRLYKFGSYEEHRFTLTRAGYVDVTLSGDNAQAAYFFIFIGDGYYVLWISTKDNPKKARFWARRGDHRAEVYYYSRPWESGIPSGAYIAYVLTVDYPGKTSTLQNVSATPKIFDPSGDNEGNSLEKTNISYTLGGSANVTVEVRDSENRLVRRILSDAAQEAGAYNLFWDGLDSEENIAEEGMYKVVMKIKDASGNEIDLASVEVEVKYHLGH